MTKNMNNAYAEANNPQTDCSVTPESLSEKSIETGSPETRTILDCFEQTAVSYGRHTAVIDPDRRMTYGELFETAQRMGVEIAKRLHSRTAYPSSDAGCRIET